MAKEKKNTCFDTFAWLIHREVEKYINEHELEYEFWISERMKGKESEVKEDVS